MKKGQAAMEYLMVFAWAIVVMTIMSGVIYYFDFFNVEKYKRQYCNFDANFFCTDFNAERFEYDKNMFHMTLMLENNMNKGIILENVMLFDSADEEINCQNIFIYCPFDDNNIFGHVSQAGVIFPGTDTIWIPTRVCKFDFEICNADRALKPGDKLDLKVNIKFKGDSSNTPAATEIYNSYGSIYVNVQ